jgi:hypothetical protein
MSSRKLSDNFSKPSSDDDDDDDRNDDDAEERDDDVQVVEVTAAPPTIMMQAIALALVLDVTKVTLLATNVDQTKTTAFRGRKSYGDTGDCRCAVDALALLLRASEVCRM